MPPVHSKRLPYRYIHHSGLDRQNRSSPCEQACPAGNCIQSINFLLAQNRTDEALAFLLSRNPFPGITGRVCPHFCESDCNRRKHDDGVSIQALERRAADRGNAAWPERAPDTGKKVAIAGAGPAGLACACYLALLGHTVTIFEKEPVCGGLPRTAIPDFRLPKQIVDRETAGIFSAGNISIHTNTMLGRDFQLQDVAAKYDACVIATGLQMERKLNVPGAELAIPAVAWLKKMNMNRASMKGKRIVIIGGGGVAMDCALTASRLGAASIEMVCLEPKDAMRAAPEELAEASAAGVCIHNSHTVKSLTRKDGNLAVITDKIKNFSFDAAGSVILDIEPGREMEIQSDMVICASGLKPDLSALGDGLPAAALTGYLETAETGASSIPGLFVAGDMQHGPSSVAQAIGSGRRAAIAVHRYLSGIDPKTGLNIFVQDNKIKTETVLTLGPVHITDYEEMLNVEQHERAPGLSENKKGEKDEFLPFAESSECITEQEAQTEASRCLHCGQCSECSNCVDACPGHILIMGPDGPEVGWPEECWHCGCCRIACPNGAISYKFPLTMMI